MRVPAASEKKPVRQRPKTPSFGYLNRSVAPENRVGVAQSCLIQSRLRPPSKTVAH
jgi:hypothetical protein